MSNIHLREKVRKITKSVAHHEQIPEQSKKVGLRVFFLFCGIGILSLFTLAVSLFIYQKPLGAIITIGITIVVSYFIYKIQSADELPSD